MHDYLSYASEKTRDTLTVALDALCEKSEDVQNEIRSNACKHYLEKTSSVTSLCNQDLTKDIFQVVTDIISRNDRTRGLFSAVLLGIEDTKRIRIFVTDEFQDEEYNACIEIHNDAELLKHVTCFQITKKDQEKILRKLMEGELSNRLFVLVDKIETDEVKMEFERSAMHAPSQRINMIASNQL